jgi:hypothetical protein
MNTTTPTDKKAVKELPKDKTADEAGKESFPASDSPASGLPDKPPANADEKWKAARKAKARQRAKRRRHTTV